MNVSVCLLSVVMSCRVVLSDGCYITTNWVQTLHELVYMASASGHCPKLELYSRAGGVLETGNPPDYDPVVIT